MGNGLTVSEYCKKYQLTVSSFYHWVKKGRVLKLKEGVLRGNSEVSLYCDRPVLSNDDWVSLPKFNGDEELEGVLSLVEVKKVVGKYSLSLLTSRLKEFGDSHDGAVVSYSNVNGTEPVLFGLDNSYLLEFLSSLGISTGLDKVNELPNARVEFGFDLVKDVYPVNVALRIAKDNNLGDDFLNNINLSRLSTLVDALPSLHSSVLKEYFLSGKTLGAIASSLNLTKEGVRFRLLGALSELSIYKGVYYTENYPLSVGDVVFGVKD